MWGSMFFLLHVGNYHDHSRQCFDRGKLVTFVDGDFRVDILKEKIPRTHVVGDFGGRCWYGLDVH